MGIDERQCKFQCRSDVLHGLTVVLRKRSAQAFVTGDERIQGGMERTNIECAVQTQGDRDVIGGLSGVQLFEEPQAFLCEGQRHMRWTRECLQRRQRASGRSVERKRLGKRCNAGCIEQGAQGQFDRKRFTQARNELRCEQRMTTEREEVIEDADAFETEHAGEALRERMFDRRARRDISGEVLPLRIGQCATIELAIGRERQRIEHDEGRWHHIVGQTRIEMFTQGARIDL